MTRFTDGLVSLAGCLSLGGTEFAACNLTIMAGKKGCIVPAEHGYFIDWNGKARGTDDPGGGYLCEIDTVARYVAITTGTGALVHEATFYRSLEAIEKAGIKAELVSGETPWGKSSEGF